MLYSDYARYDAIALAEMVAKGEVQPAELLEAAIGRAEAINPKINAIVLKHYDLARQAVERGVPRGALRGVPFLLKDLHLALKGTVTSEGSRFLKDAVRDHDSTLVERYRAAGLMIFGKTASPEFGGTATTESKLWGETKNPWNLAYSAGGSSGGAAAAVAAGIVPAASASDGGGSIRIPAANCGLFGLKPTRARTPMGPLRFEGWDGLSVVHAISRSVRDSAVLLDISQGRELGAPYCAPPRERPYLDEVGAPAGRLKVALMRIPAAQTPVDPECLKAVEDAARLCESLGHHVEQAAPPVRADEMFAAIGTAINVALVVTIKDREKVLGRPATEADLELQTWLRYQQGLEVSGERHARARGSIHTIGRILAEFQRSYDLILSPVMAVPPVKLGVLSLSQPADQYIPAAINSAVFTQLYNITGQPAMSVPLHWTVDGLPVGVMFAARFGDEATLFRLAAQLEEARPWADRRPAV